jgi:hypothetical protein
MRKDEKRRGIAMRGAWVGSAFRIMGWGGGTPPRPRILRNFSSSGGVEVGCRKIKIQIYSNLLIFVENNYRFLHILPKF